MGNGIAWTPRENEQAWNRKLMQAMSVAFMETYGSDINPKELEKYRDRLIKICRSLLYGNCRLLTRFVS